MFIFANQYILYCLIAVPVLALLFIYCTYRRKADLKKFGDMELLKSLMPGVSYGRPQVKFYLALLALAGLIVVCARPQSGAKLETVKRKGLETVVAMDVSNSMLAEDIAPNRLEKTKQMMQKFVDGLDNDKLGMVIFAGKAYTQLPLTADYQAAKMYISNISTGLIRQQGTAIGGAIDLAMRSFSDKEEIGRSIVVITDSENHEDDAVAKAKEAYEKGIIVNVIGVGSLEGGPIPDGRGGFRKDKDGNPVVTKMNEAMGQQIAEAGGGVYVRADNATNAMKVLKEEMDKVAKGETESKVYSEYNEQYQIIAWIVLLLLLLEFCILERKNGFFAKFKLFD